LENVPWSLFDEGHKMKILICHHNGSVFVPIPLPARVVLWLTLTVMLPLAAACSRQPLAEFSVDTPPLMMMPLSQTATHDDRGRFREILCAVLEHRCDNLPYYRPCDDVLFSLADEPPFSSRPVSLGLARSRLIVAIVPGVVGECVQGLTGTFSFAREHLHSLGYRTEMIMVDGLSGTVNNARQIRDAVLEMAEPDGEERIVLVGYSKGAPDALEALVTYPEIRDRVAAMVSMAGAVGGSLLANDAPETLLELATFLPGMQCDPGDGLAIHSLRPVVRQRWLAHHQLPDSIPFFSLVSFANRDRISNILVPSYNKLSVIDPRNDGQVLFYDQIIPGSTLLGYVNADHWAVALPLARRQPTLGSTFVDRNDFPREALLEAVVRYVEERLLNPLPDERVSHGV
jgi:pimeloyl-ACP methyl ester carboxylesterase